MNTLATLDLGSPPCVSAVPVTEREQYEHLFDRLPFPHLTQAWGYGEGNARKAGPSNASSSSPMAVPRRYVRCWSGAWRACRSRPVSIVDLCSWNARRRRSCNSVFCARCEAAGVTDDEDLLLIAPALPLDPTSAALLRTSGFIQRRAGGWGSSLIDLEPSPDAIRASFSSKWRNRLNGAIKAGVGVRIRRDAEAFEWMLQRHMQNMAEKNFVGPDPRFVRAMIAASPDKFCVVQGLLADEPVSGVIWTTHGVHAETFLSWTCDAGRRAGAHNLLIWHAILAMKAAGCRALDLGGYTTREKYGAYKRELKGREYRLCGKWLAFLKIVTEAGPFPDYFARILPTLLPTQTEQPMTTQIVSSNFDTDVLIVGAGPTGLALATTLHRAGVSALIVDKLETGQNTSRAAVIHAHTLEVLDAIGVSHTLAHEGLKLTRFTLRDRDRKLVQLNFDELPSHYPHLLMLPQDSTERILRDALARRASVCAGAAASSR